MYSSGLALLTLMPARVACRHPAGEQHHNMNAPAEDSRASPHALKVRIASPAFVGSLTRLENTTHTTGYLASLRREQLLPPAFAISFKTRRARRTTMPRTWLLDSPQHLLIACEHLSRQYTTTFCILHAGKFLHFPQARHIVCSAYHLPQRTMVSWFITRLYARTARSSSYRTPGNLHMAPPS